MLSSFEDQLKGAKFKAVPVVTDGNITTSRGMGTSILLGLELVKLLKDVKHQRSSQKQL